MAEEALIVVLFVVAFGLAFALGMPIAFSMGSSAMLVLLILDFPLHIIHTRMLNSVGNFVFIAVPLFLLAGNIMNQGGITERLIDFAKKSVGWYVGGLGQVSVIANMIMSGMTGSDIADASGTGKILIPAMKRSGYPAGSASAIIAAAVVMGPMIPPSIAFIIYGAITEQSIGRLFLAGTVPGLAIALVLMMSVYITGRRQAWPVEQRVGFKEWFRSFIGAIPAMGVGVIVLGGILGGVFTPTEASAIAVAYSLLVGMCLYRELPLSRLWGILLESAKESAALLFIVASAGAVIWVIGIVHVADVLVDLSESVTSSPLVFLLFVNILFLLLGTFLDVTTQILIFGPLFGALAVDYGVDPAQFGVIFVLTGAIGQMTPPYGLTMFLLMRIAGIDMGEYTKAMWPFLAALIISLFLITYVPALTLWLPGIVFDR